MYSVVQKVSKSLLRRYTLPKFLAHTARTFGKVFHFTSKATTAPTPPTAPTAPPNRPCGSHSPPFPASPPSGVRGSSSFVIRHSSLVPRHSSLGDFQSSSENSIDYTIFNNFFQLVPLRGFGGSPHYNKMLIFFV